MTRVVALGDSFSCGEGVGVRVEAHRTWVARLARRLPGGTLTSLAEPGARFADIRVRQLPAAPAADLVTVLAGLNDVARSGFDASKVRADLLAAVDTLTSRETPVLLGRLHDPSRPLSLPWPLYRLVRNRIAQLNAAVDEAAAHPGVLVLDLATVPALAEPAGWAVDRVHPSVAGHAAVADRAACLLRGLGWPVLDEPAEALPRAEPRLARLHWCAVHGLPYAVRHGGDFAVPLLTAWRAPRAGRASTA